MYSITRKITKIKEMLHASVKLKVSEEDVNRELNEYISLEEPMDEHQIQEIFQAVPNRIPNNEQIQNLNHDHNYKLNIHSDNDIQCDPFKNVHFSDEQKTNDPMFCILSQDKVAAEAPALNETMPMGRYMTYDNRFESQQQNNRNSFEYADSPEYNIYDSALFNFESYNDFRGNMIEESETTPDFSPLPEVNNDSVFNMENRDQNISNNMYSEKMVVYEEFKPKYQSNNNNDNIIITGFADLNVNSPIDRYLGGVEIIKSEEEDSIISIRLKKSVTPPTIPRRHRATKKELKYVDMVERKRKQARNNTANYNKKMKKGKEELISRCNHNRSKMEGMKMRNSNIKENMRQCLLFCKNIENSLLITMFNHHEQQNYINIKNIEADINVFNLKKKWGEAKKEYINAVNNLEQKTRNPNTYGSKKSRAKSKEEVAELKYSLAVFEKRILNLQMEFENLELLKKEWLNEFKKTISKNDITLRKMMTMTPEQLELFEKLLTFFGLPNPS